MLTDLLAERPVIEVVERDDGCVFTGKPDYYLAPFRSWWAQERRAMRFARAVLDFGCGAGRVGLHLQSRGHEVVGVDVSPLAVEVARARTADARLGTLQQRPRGRQALRHDRGSGTTSASSAASVRVGACSRADPPCRQQGPHSGRLVRPYDGLELALSSSQPARGRMGGVERLRVHYRQFATPWYDVLFASREELTGLVDGTGWMTSRFVDEGLATSPYSILKQVAGDQPCMVQADVLRQRAGPCSVNGWCLSTAAGRDLRDRPLQRRLRLIEVRADRPARSGVCGRGDCRSWTRRAASGRLLRRRPGVRPWPAGPSPPSRRRPRPRPYISAFDEILGHRRNGKVDLTANDLADRALVEPALRRAAGFIQVRTDPPGSSGLRNVAAAALLLEEGLPWERSAFLAGPRRSRTRRARSRRASAARAIRVPPGGTCRLLARDHAAAKAHLASTVEARRAIGLSRATTTEARRPPGRDYADGCVANRFQAVVAVS